MIVILINSVVREVIEEVGVSIKNIILVSCEEYIGKSHEFSERDYYNTKGLRSCRY